MCASPRFKLLLPCHKRFAEDFLIQAAEAFAVDAREGVFLGGFAGKVDCFVNPVLLGEGVAVERDGGALFLAEISLMSLKAGSHSTVKVTRPVASLAALSGSLARASASTAALTSAAVWGLVAAMATRLRTAFFIKISAYRESRPCRRRPFCDPFRPSCVCLYCPSSSSSFCAFARIA